MLRIPVRLVASTQMLTMQQLRLAGGGGMVVQSATGEVRPRSEAPPFPSQPRRPGWLRGGRIESPTKHRVWRAAGCSLQRYGPLRSPNGGAPAATPHAAAWSVVLLLSTRSVGAMSWVGNGGRRALRGPTTARAWTSGVDPLVGGPTPPLGWRDPREAWSHTRKHSSARGCGALRCLGPLPCLGLFVEGSPVSRVNEVLDAMLWQRALSPTERHAQAGSGVPGYMPYGMHRVILRARE